MNRFISLQSQAVNAAKQQQWELAISLNQEILTLKPDIGAYNRLGIAYLQLGNKKKATAAFKAVLSLDKSNPIAKKHLARVSKNQVVSAPTFQRQQFIEEPGKTKTVALHRLAGKEVLETLAVGQPCALKPKNRYISIEADKKYLGSLPEDISFRLTKLMESGNSYQAWTQAVGEASCSIFIKEVSRSTKNQFNNSFPTTKSSLSALNEIDESLLMEENIPVEHVETDNDDDRSSEDI